MSTSPLMMGRIYAALVGVNIQPVCVLDLEGRYAVAKYSPPGHPAFAPDADGGLLAATLHLWRNPFIHPDQYVKDRASDLLALAVDDAIHRRIPAGNLFLDFVVLDPRHVMSGWESRLDEDA